MSRPFSSLPRRDSIASLAESSSPISTKPKPLARPRLSLITLAETTLPNGANVTCRSPSVVSCARFPMNSLLLSGRPSFLAGPLLPARRSALRISDAVTGLTHYNIRIYAGPARAAAPGKRMLPFRPPHGTGVQVSRASGRPPLLSPFRWIRQASFRGAMPKYTAGQRSVNAPADPDGCSRPTRKEAEHAPSFSLRFSGFACGVR